MHAEYLSQVINWKFIFNELDVVSFVSIGWYIIETILGQFVVFLTYHFRTVEV